MKRTMSDAPSAPAPERKCYVLELADKKYYVGMTTREDPMERISEHGPASTGCGAEWTRQHPPLRTLIIKPMGSPFEEDMTTKEMMAKHGIENVRGGSYCNVTLTREQMTLLEREIRHAQNKCFLCGDATHYAMECKVSPTQPRVKAMRCYRCGRTSHISRDCFAKTTYDGNPIEIDLTQTDDEDDGEDDDEDDEDEEYEEDENSGAENDEDVEEEGEEDDEEDEYEDDEDVYIDEPIVYK
jgi:predicted GIY-YIG superfamily endonuclease